MRIKQLRRQLDRGLGELLIAQAAALIAGLAWSTTFTSPGTGGEADSLFALTEELHRTLVPVEPSPIFVRELRRRLMDEQIEQQLSLWARTRQLPLPVQIAAGIGGATLTAGIVIFARRPLMDAIGELRNRRTVSA